MIEPDFKTFSRLTRQGNVIPVVRRITADLLTPVSAYLRLVRRGGLSFLLESIEGGEKIARYSFMGVGPFRQLRYRDGMAEITEGGLSAGKGERRSGDLFDQLRRLTRAYRPVAWPGLPPFTSGAVGYFSYDVARLLERLPNRTRDDLGLPDAHLLFFSDLLVFDHVRHQILLIANVFLEGRSGLRHHYNHAVKRLDAMATALRQPPPEPRATKAGRASPSKVHSNVRKADFLAAVRQAKRHIRAGDVYQLVLSQRFQTRLRTDPFSLYRALRMINPSPYMFFLNLGEVQLVGASPEMLV